MARKKPLRRSMCRQPKTFLYTVTEAEKEQQGYGTTIPTCSHCLRLREKTQKNPAN